ncbi:MAG: ABC-F family ATP-binding cassette domain-containing protein [Bacteriodetes bacterium]|nr:ABC-F family ATP-binding cassette domain-containing protein [Bacteroidota bacterium]
MITISHITIRFGGKALFDDITFTINPRDRIGLVGKNGAGKSSLLKLLAKLHRADEGEIITPNAYTIGYLPQDGITAAGKTVFDEVASHVFTRALELNDKVHKLSDELTIRTDYESDEYSKILHDMSDANDEFIRLGGATMRADIESILNGLGFTTADMDRLCEEFSGGWQMRIELGKILLRKPDCILLDEPTNHLDIESVQWLEQFLKNYEGAVVLVSHDKTFLDTVTNRTIEITNGDIDDYNCAYSKYLEQRAERRSIQMSAAANQEREIAQQERFIERFKAKASFASRAQSRVKMLDKIERIEVEEEDTSSIRFQFPPAPRSGLSVVETHGLNKSYGTKHVLHDIEFSLGRGERVAFVGKNGEGKSTFSRLIAGSDEFEGTLTLGHNVVIGYYEQHQAESLDSDASVFDIIDRAAKGEMRTKIRSLLGAFLFSGDSVNKKVRVLSGGEKSRLAMAKLLLEPVNLLILDEPTNHLDMKSKDVLKQALMDYEGALIVVSHDRDFLQGLTTKVIEFREGKLTEYLGDIYGYLQARKLESFRQLEASRAEKASAKEEKKPMQVEREQNKQKDNETRKIKRSIEQCEERIAELESTIKQLDSKLADAEFYKQKDFSTTVEQHNKAKEELARKMEEWAALSEQLS